MTVAAMLRNADALLDQPIEDLGATWPRGAAVLVRQAIEKTVTTWWSQTAPAMERTSWAEQWWSLPCYLDDPKLIAQANYAWSALSEVCHHRGYDLGLTEQELRGHLNVADRFARLVAAQLRARAEAVAAR